MGNDLKPKSSAAASLEQLTLDTEFVTEPVKQTTKVEVKGKDDKDYAVVKDDIQDLENKFFIRNPVRVFTDYSRTINMGNYESAKITVGLSIPIGVDISQELKDQIIDGHKWATDLIGHIVSEEEKGLRQYLKEKK